MSGECRLNMGVGEANVTLIGSESDYKISFSTGIGGANFNGENIIKKSDAHTMHPIFLTLLS